MFLRRCVTHEHRDIVGLETDIADRGVVGTPPVVKPFSNEPIEVPRSAVPFRGALANDGDVQGECGRYSMRAIPQCAVREVRDRCSGKSKPFVLEAGEQVSRLARR